MKKVISFLQHVSNGKVVLIIFILTNLVYGLILGYSIPLVLSFAPEAMLFDMSPTGYSYAQAMELLRSLGVEGRSAYLTVQIPIDLVYPAMFAASYALLITWVLKKFRSKESKLFSLAFIPMLAGIFDYLENFCIIAMLTVFPEVPESLVTSASIFTIAKSGFTTVFFVVLFFSLAALAMSVLKKKQRLAGDES